MLEATEITLDRLELWLSEPRLNMYLRAADDDPWRAYELYLWNANLAQVLLRDISFFEVALRNSHDRCMTKRWNGEAHWLLDPLSPVRSPILRKSKRSSIFDANAHNRRAIDAIANGPRGTTNPNRIVSRLTLGFWTHLSDTNHERALWIPYLHTIWPKGFDRSKLYASLNMINTMRNRAAHAEKLFNLGGELSVRNCDDAIVRLMQALAPSIADRMTNKGQLTPVEHYLMTFRLEPDIKVEV